MVHTEGLEPSTCGLEDHGSVLLSYVCITGSAEGTRTLIALPEKEVS